MSSSNLGHVGNLDAGKQELEALRNSGFFDTTSNIWKLLEFLCSKAFAGESDLIKEYNIAVELFGRSEDFDKKRDSIVRVEAHRLRKRLQQFYNTEGIDHPVQIVIPPGQYAPTFFVRDLQPPPELIPAQSEIQPVALPTDLIRQPEVIPPPRPRPFGWSSLLIASGIIVLIVAVAILASTRTKSPAVAASEPRLLTTAKAGDETVRILCGARQGNFLDSAGRRWSGDIYFTGGSPRVTDFRPIARTRDATTFLKSREGDFQYRIPLKPGLYELRLFFAETVYGEGNLEGGGETSRMFNIRANGNTLLDGFDVICDAGGANTADVKVFKNITPGEDGFLNLEFVSMRNGAFVNAIELTPGDARGLKPIRLVARDTEYIDSQGNEWLPETYFQGGRTTLRREEVTGTPDPGLYQGEHYGNFSVSIPVPQGRYAVTLHFAETWHGPNRPNGGGVGSRVFDVYHNGVALLQNFDILKETGKSYVALKKKFSGLQPNAQDKLVFTFVPRRNYACVNAIEVTEETR